MSTQQTPDYTSYSHDDLLKRVTELEAQLSAWNSRHARPDSATISIATPKKKPKKPAKAFDPSKYNTRHIALKFAYLGSNYNGFEHHTNNTTRLPTIEEELWRALMKTRLIFPTSKDGQSQDEVCWDGCEYSKCGRTDRGVSAFGQVIGVRVRSARPKAKPRDEGNGVHGSNGIVERSSATDSGEDQAMRHASLEAEDTSAAESAGEEPSFDPISDELPYIQLLNRVLPPDIRILAWCANPPEDFSARFNCKERRYRYFFTNPAYTPPPSMQLYGRGDAHIPDGCLDVEAMDHAAKKLEGLHDFRNFCKIDPSKQITNFERRIFHAAIHSVGAAENRKHPAHSQEGQLRQVPPQLYFFEVRGSAFLWHQVRHLVAVLFLVGQGYEAPDIVDQLLDVEKCPSKPMYEMASDTPLVLWDCVFPDAAQLAAQDHQAVDPSNAGSAGYEDALDWIYIGDEAGGRDTSKRATPGDDGKYGRNGIMDELWSLWRRRKIDEVLASSLMDVVARQGGNGVISGIAEQSADHRVDDLAIKDLQESARVFDGGDRPRNVGKYIPLMRRDRMETSEVVNARYAARKGLEGSRTLDSDADVDE